MSSYSLQLRVIFFYLLCIWCSVCMCFCTQEKGIRSHCRLRGLLCVHMCMHAQERNSVCGLRVSFLCPCWSQGSQTLTCWAISLSLHTYSWLFFPPSLFSFSSFVWGMVSYSLTLILLPLPPYSLLLLFCFMVWSSILSPLPLSFSLPLHLPTTALLLLLPHLPSSSLACLSLEVETQNSLSRIGHHDGRIQRKLTRHWMG